MFKHSPMQKKCIFYKEFDDQNQKRGKRSETKGWKLPKWLYFDT